VIQYTAECLHTILSLPSSGVTYRNVVQIGNCVYLFGLKPKETAITMSSSTSLAIALAYLWEQLGPGTRPALLRHRLFSISLERNLELELTLELNPSGPTRINQSS
jgi:hypothetical protein